MKGFIYLAIILIIVILLYYVYRKNFKILQVPSVCIITGGVKCGKSLLASTLSKEDYKKRHFVWRIKHAFNSSIEEPLYYCNNYATFGSSKRKKPHRLDKNIRFITLEHLLRKYRFNYGSVIYIQESSLLADNMDYNNAERNARLSLFNKLVGHETKGGSLYYDTQSILDSHYSIKRVASTYFFIQKKINFLGLFMVLYVREMINQENGVNAFNDDVETTMRKVLIPRWWFFRYNRYEYSYLTDDLDKMNIPYDTKTRKLVSFNPLYTKLANSTQERKEENK